jgi:hypothetical protein
MKIKEYPFYIKVITLPGIYILMILKVLYIIPIWIIAKCNTIEDNLG